MKFYGYTIACIVISFITSTLASEKYAVFRSSSSSSHGRYPRSFFGGHGLFGTGIFSRPKSEAPKEKATIKHHVTNVLHGGSIGFAGEFRPLEPVHKFINHAMKFIPQPPIIGFHKPKGTGMYPDKTHGVPEKTHGVPDKTPDVDYGKYPEPDKKPASIESEEGDWEYRNPEKPKPHGPKWEEIGEEDESPSDYEVPKIEDIIMPRRNRPRRFIESKVYHVPLEFLSNAKPSSIKVNGNAI